MPLGDRDFKRINGNLQKLFKTNTPDADVSAYLNAEGVTVKQVNDSLAPGFGETVADVGNQFFDKFNKGVGDVLDAPTNAAFAVGRALGLDIPEAGDKNMLQKMLADPNTPFPFNPGKAKTTAGRIAGRTGELAAIDLPLAALTLGAAPALKASTQLGIQAAQSGAKALAPKFPAFNSFLNQIAQGVTRGPGRAGIGEAAATIGGGAGLAAVDELAPDSSVGTKLLAGLAGGATPAALGPLVKGIAKRAPTVTGARFLARQADKLGRRHLGEGFPDPQDGVGGVVSRFTGDEAENRAKTVVRDAINDELSDRSQANLRRSATIQDRLPDTEFNIAEQSLNPGLIRSKEVFNAQLGGKNLDKEIARRLRNEDVIRRGIDEMAPGNDATNPTRSFKTISDGADAELRRIHADEGRVFDDELLLGDALRSPDDLRKTGGAMRGALELERRAVKDGFNVRAEKEGLNEKSAFIPGMVRVAKSVRTAFQNASAVRLKGGKLPKAQVKALKAGLKKFKNIDDTQSIVAIQELRRDLVGIKTQVLRQGGGTEEVAGIEAMISAFDDGVENAIRSVGDPDLLERLAKFRADYKRDVFDVFDQGAAFRVRDKGGKSAYKMRDEKVAAEFFKAGDEQAALQYLRIFGNSPDALAHMETAALDNLFRATATDGVLDLAKVRRWMAPNRFGPVLDIFPNIRAKVQNTEALVKSMVDRRAVLKERIGTVEKNIFTKQARAVDELRRPADAIVLDALKDPRKMAGLMRSMKPGPARNGLKRAVWQGVFGKDLSNAIQYMTTHERSLRIALGKEGFDNAGLLIDAMVRTSQLQVPKGVALTINPSANIEEWLGFGINQASSRVFAVASGRTSTRFIALDLLGRFLRGYSERRARQLLEEALADPAFAKELASFISPLSRDFGGDLAAQTGDTFAVQQFARALTPAKAKRFYTFLFSIGLGPDITGDQNNQ